MNFFRKNKFLLQALFVVALLSTVLGFSYNLFENQNQKQALAASEPACQAVSNSPVWNPYPINTSFPNPIVTPGNCQDMPMLSFFPVDTQSGNPRERNILRSQNIAIQLYYINGAVPGSAPITSPTVRMAVTQVSPTRYRISAELSGANTGTVTSAQKGGDLFVNVPAGTNFSIVANSTDHFPDAIERKEEADATGRRPNDPIPDNTVGSNVSNPIYSQFLNRTLTSTSGFVVKPQGLEAGFLGYGYILTQIGVQVVPQQIPNNPPTINGDEITITRGQQGTFNQPIRVSDPDGDYPVTVDTSQVPANCTVQGTPDAQGSGQTITCTTDQNTPSRFTFNLIPTDSRGLVGQPGTWIVNVIDPQLTPEKKCFLKNTNTECNTAPLRAGDEVTYRITATNNSNVVVNNVRIVDTYDRERLENITNISSNGQHNQQAGTITWTNLGNLAASESVSVTFDATVSGNVELGDTVVNIALVSADNIPEREVRAEFVIGGTLNLVKRCFVRNTQTPCTNGSLTSGSEITYEIEVSNSTDSTITNVVLTDRYDFNRLTDITNINPSGNLDTSAGTIVWNLGDFEPGFSRIVRFDARIAQATPPGTVIRNVAIVRADNIPEREVTVEFPTIGPVLVSEKLCFRRGTGTNCSNANLLPNEFVTYVIRVTNVGTVAAEEVTITDTYDASKLTGITNIVPNGQLNTANATITWNIGTLAIGRSVEVKFDAQIRPEVPTGAIVVNTAVIRARDIPDQTVRADFPIQFLVDTTPRTGGGIALLIVAISMALGAGGYYYYKKNNKLSGGFVPQRSTEIKPNPQKIGGLKKDRNEKRGLIGRR